MFSIITRIREIFQSPKPQLIDKVLAEIEVSQKTNTNCILVISETGEVYRQDPPPSANIALIGHEKVKQFQNQLLDLENQLIQTGHYCIFKLAEDKSYATAFIYIDEFTLN